EGLLQQMEALLGAADSECDHSGFVTRAGISELWADQSNQLRQAAQVLLQRFESLREPPGLFVLALGTQALDEEVKRLRVARLGLDRLAQPALGPGGVAPLHRRPPAERDRQVRRRLATQYALDERHGVWDAAFLDPALRETE